jgi:hypothetical protein
MSLIYSMSVSVDGFINDREGGFAWSVPDEELFRFHLARVRELGCHLCGRRLYETMLVWETDPSLRETELDAAFADVWCALPKVVFSRTLTSVQGNARLAEASVAEEVAAALGANVRLACDLRALQERPRFVGLTAAVTSGSAGSARRGHGERATAIADECRLSHSAPRAPGMLKA